MNPLEEVIELTRGCFFFSICYLISLMNKSLDKKGKNKRIIPTLKIQIEDIKKA